MAEFQKVENINILGSKK